MDLWLDENIVITRLNHRLRSACGLALFLLIALLTTGNALHAQVNRYLKEGNKFYEQQKYKEAAEDYARALQKDPNNTSGMFNLGNSLYQQQQFDASRKVMTETEKKVKDKNGKAAANYNIGNTYMEQKKWEDAINAYKQTLRNNPQDADAKYNLSYAKQMMKKEQDKDKKDQDKKDKQEKDKQEKPGKDEPGDKDKKDPKEKEPQEQQSKLTQQEAENLLNAMEQSEKKLQDKLKKEKGVPVKLQKDW